MSAAELVASGVDANTDALERVMRICASVGVLAESDRGKFGPTPLSDDCRLAVSIKGVARGDRRTLVEALDGACRWDSNRETAKPAGRR